MTAIDKLYDVVDVETAVRDVLRTQLPATASAEVYAGILPTKTATPYVLLTVRAPAASGPMMAGDQRLDVTLSVTVAGPDHVTPSRIAAAVRQIIIGRDRRGAFTTALPIAAGRAVLTREGNSDGAPDNVGGVQQWTETFKLVIGRA